MLYTGWIFKAGRHREYLRHIARYHHNENNLVCQFGRTCKQAFYSFQLLKDHVDNVHETTASSSSVRENLPKIVNTACRCSVAKCGSVQFSNILCPNKFSFHLDWKQFIIT